MGKKNLEKNGMGNLNTDNFRRQYFEILDVIATELNNCFDQIFGMPAAAIFEKVLLNAANGERLNYLMSSRCTRMILIEYRHSSICCQI